MKRITNISLGRTYLIRYVTFWRKVCHLLAQKRGDYVTFWRKVCHLLAQGMSPFGASTFRKSLILRKLQRIFLLINNLKNNLTNYSNKLFNKERGASQKVFGLLGRPLSPAARPALNE